MRIVHLVQRFHPQIGGAEGYVRDIALEQARRGHTVTVATTQPAGAPAEETLARDGASIRIVRFPTRHWRGDYLVPPWLPMKGAREWLAKEPMDLVHAHSYRFHTLEEGARVARERGIPYVAGALGFYPPENLAVEIARRVYDPRRGRAALAAASRCVALTSDEVQHYEALGVPAERVDVVPAGLAARALEPGDGPGFRKRHDLHGPVVLFLARLAHDKGLVDLVQAMTHVPHATLAVVGPDAGARAAAERIATRAGIQHRVRFLGRVDDTRDAYAACDVFVHPSHYEAFGMVIVEAQAQGRPVVTTTAGGIPEAAGDAAVLVPPRNADALAGAILELLDDPARRAALGEAGRARAPQYLWPHVVTKLEATYARALGG